MWIQLCWSLFFYLHLLKFCLQFICKYDSLTLKQVDFYVIASKINDWPLLPHTMRDLYSIHITWWPWGILMLLPSKPNYVTMDCLQCTVIKDARTIDFYPARCLVKAYQRGAFGLSQHRQEVFRSHYAIELMQHSSDLSHMMKCEWKLVVINGNVSASSQVRARLGTRASRCWSVLKFFWMGICACGAGDISTAVLITGLQWGLCSSCQMLFNAVPTGDLL